MNHNETTGLRGEALIEATRALLRRLAARGIVKPDTGGRCSCGNPKPSDMGCCDACAEPDREVW